MKKFLALLLFVLPAILLPAQNNPCQKTTEGTDFWFGFMEGRNFNEDHYVEITVSASTATTFKITIGPEENLFGEFTVNANTPRRIKIPWELAEATESEEPEPKGIHLVSENPVNVYALSWGANTADVALIYPVKSLGNEYFAMAYTPYETGNPPSNSQFLIVATEDETEVEITPSRVTDKYHPRDSTFTVTLNKGEVYQVQSDNTNNPRRQGQGDLTGSHIRSGKPVAVYSGSISTTIPEGVCCWDYISEQIPPVQSWGLEYFVVPLKSRREDRYRIMAANDNTTVYITGESPFTLDQGAFKEKVFPYTDPKKILADKPVMVAQYSQSNKVDSVFTGGNGDPFMIILSSSSQTKNDVTFVAYDSNQIRRYYVNVVALTEETGNLRLAGDPIENEFTPFEDGKYSWAQIALTPGHYRLQNMNPDRGFLAYVYGYGGIESYGYGVGYNLNIVLDLGKSLHFEGDTLTLCYGETRTLDAGPYFDTFSWNTGETSQTITVDREGKYHVKATTIDGCELEDSIYLFMSHPETDLGMESAEGCAPYALELDAGENFSRYLWQNEKGDTLSTNRTITANQTGEYRITVFDNLGCSARDTLDLEVFPVPEVQLDAPSLICGEKSVLLSAAITGTSDSIWKSQNSFQWLSEDNRSVQFSEESHTSAQMEVDDWDEYEVIYNLQTIDGCVTSDTLNTRFHPTPESGFLLENDEECEGYSQKLQFKGSATDSATFFWDLDGCAFLDTTGWQEYTVSVGAFLDEPPNISLYINDNGCLSDTTFQPVGAEPNFTMDASPARGCDDLTVNFEGRLIVEDNVDFHWNFHDGETAETQQTTQHYSQPGFYDVTLTVVNPVTQCMNSYTLDSMVKVFPTPVAEISADPDRCYADTAQIIYANNIDSSLCHWEVDGMTRVFEADGMLKAVLDDPTAAVRLVVDEHGCISDTTEMLLKRKPHFDFFTEISEGCQPFSTEIIARSGDDSLEYYWPADSLPYPSGDAYRFTFADSGRHDVSLIAQSLETGCADTLLKKDWIFVYPKPMAAFDVNYPVALIEHADLTFTNQSELADFYSWNFGDGETAGGTDAMHSYTDLGEYTSQLIAESGLGCLDTATQLITILPFSVYTPNAFRPDSPVEENRTFRPLGTGADPNRFQLEIYDRQGQRVFRTESPGESWDGTYPGGEAAPMGNYVWIARFFDIQGFKHEQKGQVMLIR